MEDIVKKFQYFQLEVTCFKKLSAEKIVNKDKGKEKTEEYHDNINIKPRIIRGFYRDTTLKNQINNNKEYTKKYYGEMERNPKSVDSAHKSLSLSTI